MATYSICTPLTATSSTYNMYVHHLRMATCSICMYTTYVWQHAVYVCTPPTYGNMQYTYVHHLQAPYASSTLQSSPCQIHPISHPLQVPSTAYLQDNNHIHSLQYVILWYVCVCVCRTWSTWDQGHFRRLWKPFKVAESVEHPPRSCHDILAGGHADTHDTHTYVFISIVDRATLFPVKFCVWCSFINNFTYMCGRTFL